MLKSFFSYFGSKHRYVRTGLYDAPKHEIIVEPFAGSAAYSLMYPDRQIILYDLNPEIACLWTYLIHVKESELLSLPIPEPGSYISDLHCCEEAKLLIAYNCKQANASRYDHISGWYDGKNSSFWCETMKIKLASQLQSIRHWKVYNRSYIDLPTASLRATWFVDPPYQVAGHKYRHGNKGIDYKHLGSWCQTLKGQTIVCENEGATWLPFRHLASIYNCQKKPTSEVVWTQQK